MALGMNAEVVDDASSIRGGGSEHRLPESGDREPSVPIWYWSALVIACGLFFVGLNVVDFTDLDEGFYSSVAMNMANTGDWVTPRFGGEPWWEKPPLLYWKMAASFQVFGLHEWAGRFPSAGSMLLTVAVTVWFARRWFGVRTAFFSGLFLATSLLSLVQSHLATTDALLTAQLTVMFVCVWEYARGGTVVWLLAAAASAGFATLTKGPVALAFSVGISGLLAWRDLPARGRLLDWRRLASAAAVYLLVVTPWYGAVMRAYSGEFLVKFLYEQNIGRALGGDAAHNLPFFATAGFVLIGFFPWSPFLAHAALRRSPQPAERFLWLWFLLIFAFFTVVKAKLPAYTLPLYPAAAILVGRKWATMHPKDRLFRRTAAILCFLLLILMATPVFADIGLGRVLNAGGIWKATACLVTTLLVGVVGQLLVAVRHGRGLLFAGALLTAGMMAAIWTTVVAFAPSYNARTWRPIHSMAEQLRGLDVDLVLFDLHPSYPSVEYYLRRPHKWVDTLEMLFEVRRPGRRTFVIAESHELSRLERLRLRLIRSSERWSLVELL